MLLLRFRKYVIKVDEFSGKRQVDLCGINYFKKWDYPDACQMLFDFFFLLVL